MVLNVIPHTPNVPDPTVGAIRRDDRRLSPFSRRQPIDRRSLKPSGERFPFAVSMDAACEGLGAFSHLSAGHKPPPFSDWWEGFLTQVGYGAEVHNPLPHADGDGAHDETEGGKSAEADQIIADKSAWQIQVSHAICEATLTIGAPKVDVDGSLIFVGKGLHQILELMEDRVDGFLLYTVARSAWELTGDNGERLFAPPEIHAVASLETPEFQLAFGEYREWSSLTLAFAREKGLIVETDDESWRLSEFAPLWRVGRHDGGDNKGEAPSGNWHGFKVLSGGAVDLREVLENVLRNTMALINAAYMNEVRLEAVRFAADNGGVMPPLPNDDHRVTAHEEDVWRAFLWSMGARPGDEPSAEAMRYLQRVFTNQRPFLEFIRKAKNGDNLVNVHRNGKAEWREVTDTVLYRALTGKEERPR